MNKLFILGSVCLIFSGTIQVLGDDYLGIPVIMMGIAMFMLRNRKNAPVPKEEVSEVTPKKRFIIYLIAFVIGTLVLLGYQYFTNGYIDSTAVVITFLPIVIVLGIQLYVVSRKRKKKD